MHTELAAVIEALVQAAVVELQRLEEDSLLFGARGPGEERHEVDRVQRKTQDKLVQFASIMETLGNEALGKILNIMDKARLVVQVGHDGKKPQTSILNILNHVTSSSTHTESEINAARQKQWLK